MNKVTILGKMYNHQVDMRYNMTPFSHIMEDLVLLALILLITIYYLRPRSPPLTIQSIIIYPVRSCAGIRLSQANIVTTGLAYDRLWTFVNSSGHQVTAKDDPRLWRIQPILSLSEEPKEMILTYEGKSVKLDLMKSSGRTTTVTMWDLTAEAMESGPEITTWIKEVLGTDYRLCKTIQPNYSQESPGVLVTFPDMRSHMLVTSIASLSTLIQATPEPKRSQLSMSCFRPNVVIDGCEAWNEDSWERIQIGTLIFAAAGPCDRCRMTTIDPETLVFDQKTEPLPTLRKIHGKDVKAFFGQFFNRTEDGIIRVGDQINVLARKSFPN